MGASDEFWGTPLTYRAQADRTQRQTGALSSLANAGGQLYGAYQKKKAASEGLDLALTQQREAQGLGQGENLGAQQQQAVDEAKSLPEKGQGSALDRLAGASPMTAGGSPSPMAAAPVQAAPGPQEGVLSRLSRRILEPIGLAEDPQESQKKFELARLSGRGMRAANEVKGMTALGKTVSGSTDPGALIHQLAPTAYPGVQPGSIKMAPKGTGQPNEWATRLAAAGGDPAKAVAGYDTSRLNQATAGKPPAGETPDRRISALVQVFQQAHGGRPPTDVELQNLLSKPDPMAALLKAVGLGGEAGPGEATPGAPPATADPYPIAR